MHAPPSLWLCLALLAGQADAGERWVHVADIRHPVTGTAGIVSLDLGSLRKRGQHYEIWERIVFAGDAGPAAVQAGDTPRKKLTLWAVRCRPGEMAMVVEGGGGSFGPRAASPEFHVPAPDSSEVVILAVACTEARRVEAALRPALTEERTPGKSSSTRGLEQPPSLLDEDGDRE